MIKAFFINSCFPRGKQLFFSCMLLWIGVLPLKALAHQAPYSVAYLDVSPGRVVAELQIPLSELALALGNTEVVHAPEKLLKEMGPQLKEYFLAHTHAWVTAGSPWWVEITGMDVHMEQQTESGPPFWELWLSLTLTPQKGELTRHFYFDYDAVVHQVLNHIVFVAIRNDWQTGRADTLTSDSNPLTIRIGSDNKVHPLEISLAEGSSMSGFKNMAALGMEHIKEGTDHLLFLLVLLLPSMLVAGQNRWGEYGGVKYSIRKLLSVSAAFTAGHSFTLLLGAMGWFSLPAGLVEVLIAVSILFSAIHAIYPVFPGKEVWVAGGFGFIHGLAFASIISGFHLQPDILAGSILAFNMGIELMQLFIILLIIPWLILLCQTPVYKWIRVGGSLVAIVLSIIWIVERV